MGDGNAAAPSRRGICLLVVGLLAVGTINAAGCGSSADKATVASKSHRDPKWNYARDRFNEMCAGCHTLADSGARGRRFNLDHDLDLTAALTRTTIRDGQPGMPGWEDVLSRREYEELALYVMEVAQRTQGETNWHWQIKLRSEGNTIPAEAPAAGR